MTRTMSAIGLLVVCCVTAPIFAATPDTDEILCSGKFDEGIATLEAHLKLQPKDDTARFGLGVIQFVSTVERLGQKLAVYGIRSYGNKAVENAFGKGSGAPAALEYRDLRRFIQEWINDLRGVDDTLSRIESDDVKVPLHVARIPLDIARSGASALTLLPFVGRNGPWGSTKDLVVAFDRSDVEWLRGYCHLLSAVAEIGLAYDAQELFDVIAHRIFVHAYTPHQFLHDEDEQPWFDWRAVADVIAAIHVVRFPVIEPKRCAAALAHIEQTVAHSRQMWKQILAEKDNDREWIPGPMQRGALGVSVSQDMVDQWIVALDETEAILQGKKLLPFWRGRNTHGVNLRRAFLEPRPLDVVLWVQGTAATPYLEKGDITRPDTWIKINEVFRGQFLTFGIWFN